MPVAPGNFGLLGFAFPWIIGGGSGTSANSSRALEYSPAEIVQQLLVNHALGVLGSPGSKAEWQVYASNEPDTPDNAVTVYDTSGSDAGRVMVTGELQGMYGVQIRVRSATHRLGYAKANQIWVAVAEEVRLEDVVIGAFRYRVAAFSNTGDILTLGKGPGDKRSSFTINTFASIRKLAS